jgi:hypothetical protein
MRMSAFGVSMERPSTACCLAIVFLAATAAAAQAQTTSAPSSGRTISPEQLGAISSPQRYMITSSANDRAAFLWIIDTIEKKVTLCEKPTAGGDFSCNKKTLP